MFLTYFVSKNHIAGFFMSKTFVENGLNYFFRVCFFFKKNFTLSFSTSWRFVYGMVSCYFEYV